MVEGDKNLDIERIRDKFSELQSTTSDAANALSEASRRMLGIYFTWEIN